MNNWISLLPPLLAILLAISTRKAYIAIFSGIILGSLILATSFISGLKGVIEALSLTLQSTSTIHSLIFILMIGAVINLLQRSAAIDHALQIISTQRALIKNRSHAQLLAFIAGFLMCLEGIGSMMIVGVVGRPLFKQFDISSQKLAYIANSTGAPLAWLLPISSAGLFLVGLIQTQIDQGVIDGVSLDYVVQAMPYQFYTLLVLLSVPLLAVFQHDFKLAQQGGSAEQRALPQSAPIVPLWVGMSPFYLLIMTIVIVVALGGDISKAIYCSGYVALIGSAILFHVNDVPYKQSVSWMVSGAIRILPAVLILTLAFTFSHVIGQLGTGQFLAELLTANLAVSLLPCLIFLIGMMISFATGSSGATVSILTPIAIPIAVQMGFPVPVVIGAVLSGAVFGDQSSPISDSVIVAASAAQCSPESHFRSQLPIVASVALVAFGGYLGVGLWL
ncbi:sodium:proton antiporter [Vibrio ponticus]|uniref:Sodium:proton antiporter n=1 Tax=Vibrio ponticus TaxID=265668 RepID=A0ABX3FHX7_9VIBR|nr:Na+/H+ antiporter NhaC family protein [Vibrio ponticus]OLQ91325.1 sodium:proton antiporter [Vibrio ponticus]